MVETTRRVPGLVRQRRPDRLMDCLCHTVPWPLGHGYTLDLTQPKGEGHGAPKKSSLLPRATAAAPACAHAPPPRLLLGICISSRPVAVGS